MVAYVRNWVHVCFLVLLVGCYGCTCVSVPPLEQETTTSTTTSTTEDLGPCGVDCAKIGTPQCTVAVCNTGQVVGPINVCVVVPVPDDSACDDVKFCTIGD